MKSAHLSHSRENRRPRRSQIHDVERIQQRLDAGKWISAKGE